MKRILLFICVAILAAVAVSAQNPIRWRLAVKMTSDTEGVITLRALVNEGWHLYGTKLPEDGPKPTHFSFAESQGIKLTGKMMPSVATKSIDDPMFGMKLNWWDCNVSFTQHFKLVKREGAKVVASVSFMACNDQNCMPPKTQTLTYIFK